MDFAASPSNTWRPTPSASASSVCRDRLWSWECTRPYCLPRSRRHQRSHRFEARWAGYPACRQEALEAMKKADAEGETEGREAASADILRLNAETDAKLEELRSVLESYRQQADEHCGRLEREVGLGRYRRLLASSRHASCDGEGAQ